MPFVAQVTHPSLLRCLAPCLALHVNSISHLKIGKAKYCNEGWPPTKTHCMTRFCVWLRYSAPDQATSVQSRLLRLHVQRRLLTSAFQIGEIHSEMSNKTLMMNNSGIGSITVIIMNNLVPRISISISISGTVIELVAGRAGQVPFLYGRQMLRTHGPPWSKGRGCMYPPLPLKEPHGANSPTAPLYGYLPVQTPARCVKLLFLTHSRHHMVGSAQCQRLGNVLLLAQESLMQRSFVQCLCTCMYDVARACTQSALQMYLAIIEVKTLGAKACTEIQLLHHTCLLLCHNNMWLLQVFLWRLSLKQENAALRLGVQQETLWHSSAAACFSKQAGSHQIGALALWSLSR